MFVSIEPLAIELDDRLFEVDLFRLPTASQFEMGLLQLVVNGRSAPINAEFS